MPQHGEQEGGAPQDKGEAEGSGQWRANDDAEGLPRWWPGEPTARHRAAASNGDLHGL
jgi:hypothetical protein